MTPQPYPGTPSPPALRTTLKAHLFATPLHTVATLAIATLAALTLPRLARWALLDAVWRTPNPADCAAAAGACWAVVAEKHRVMLFGTYPYDQQWRGTLVCLIVLLLLLATAAPRLWSRALLAAWAAGATLAAALQFGGVAGLPFVPTSAWGGLPLMLLLFTGTVAAGLPLAIALALGRQSGLRIVSAVCVGVIEIVRGIPLVNVLFAAALLVPLFLPPGLAIDKLLRVQLGLVLFFGAYTAETVRGGLLAIPAGQYDAASALGLPWWRTRATIILPQALRIVIPAIVNDLVRAFKNISLLLVIGLFDVLGGTMAALQDPAWAPYYVEAYVAVALLYFAFCFSMSQYSRALERRLALRGSS